MLTLKMTESLCSFEKLVASERSIAPSTSVDDGVLVVEVEELIPLVVVADATVDVAVADVAVADVVVADVADDPELKLSILMYLIVPLPFDFKPASVLRAGKYLM